MTFGMRRGCRRGSTGSRPMRDTKYRSQKLSHRPSTPSNRHSLPYSPQLAQLLERHFHALGGGGIGLGAAAPAESVPGLLQSHFPAHGPFQHIRSDLAGRLHRFTIALAVKDLCFGLRHSGKDAEIGRENPTKIDLRQRIAEPGMIPVVAVFLRGRVLLLGDQLARERTLERAVAHRDLTTGAAAPAPALCAAVALAWPATSPFAHRIDDASCS